MLDLTAPLPCPRTSSPTTAQFVIEPLSRIGLHPGYLRSHPAVVDFGAANTSILARWCTARIITVPVKEEIILNLKSLVVSSRRTSRSP